VLAPLAAVASERAATWLARRLAPAS